MGDILTELTWVADLEKNTPREDSVMISNRILQGTATELERLRSELREAIEIIRPFAEEAKNWTDGDGSEPLIVEHFDAEEYNRSAFQSQDLFDALAFLKEHEDV